MTDAKSVDNKTFTLRNFRGQNNIFPYSFSEKIITNTIKPIVNKNPKV